MNLNIVKMNNKENMIKQLQTRTLWMKNYVLMY